MELENAGEEIVLKVELEEPESERKDKKQDKYRGLILD